MDNRKLITLCAALLMISGVFAQDSTLLIIKEKPWYKPNYAKVQFAGNIGLLSVGFGYKFFNNHLCSDILYGYVPASVSKAKEIHTITIKNTIPVFPKEIRAITVSPITGFTVSYETGNNSFLKLPDKYPKDYYSTNAFHFTFFVGAKVHKDINNSKRINGIDFYFEVGTVDTYLLYVLKSKEVNINQIFSSAIGINLYF